jgi:hypothetical protein
VSTDWGIGCRTCAPDDRSGDRSAYFTGEWNNVRDTEALARLCTAAPLLATIPKEVADCNIMVRLDGWYSDELSGALAFFRAHAGHDLAPMSEYGDFFDQCRKLLVCATCTHRSWCVRTRGHEGECSQVTPKGAK